MLTCKEASWLSSQALDRRLTWRERILLRLHVCTCKACLRFKRQVEFLYKAAQSYLVRRLEMGERLQLPPAHVRGEPR